VTDISSQEDLDELRTAVRDFLQDTSAEADVRRVMDEPTGWDETVWRRMADELRLPALALPTEHGGDGFGFVELRIVLEELGRTLTPSPFLGSVVLAASALTASGDPVAQTTHLPGIAAGKTTAALAVAGSEGTWNSAGTTAVRDAAGDWALTGERSFVIDGVSADLLVVAAHTEGGPSLFTLPAHASGLTREPLTALDPTRRLARLTFTGTPATLVGEDGAAGPVLDRVLDLTAVALAAEQTGGARACLDASVAYAKDRRQFGRPIGSFQAVKHKCADMLVQVQLAQAAAVEAANAAAAVAGSPPLGVAAAVAHSVCSAAYVHVARENIQVHGGIGFTWEHPAHLYFRRAKSTQLLLGGPAAYHERLLTHLGA
jgi:alkylation response protein AidB-like acyl-CoA dehydrogenase